MCNMQINYTLIAYMSYFMVHACDLNPYITIIPVYELLYQGLSYSWIDNKCLLN